MCSISH